MKGILNINKPQDWTSFDVVNYLKKFLNIKHIGHLGTLDPMATGVLPVTLGSATKLFDMFLNKEKTYIAKFEFGYETDTLDATGEIKNKCEKLPTLEEIKNIIPQFIGYIMQLPPQYSAKKVNGQKACDVARRGGEIELKPSKIFIKDLEILSFENNILEMKIECGAGTYIRAIGRDIAQRLGSLATMISLVRTQVGIFKIEESIDVKTYTKEELISKIMPTDSVFSHLEIVDDEDLVNRLINGQTRIVNLKNGDYRLYQNSEFVALATVKDNKIKMTKFFA